MKSVSAAPVQDRSEKQLKGWHVLLMMLGFFSIMFTANGIFLYHAITSFPGEDVKKSYVQGLDYNRTLEARRAQRALGWAAAAGFDKGRLVFELKDANDRDIYGHDVEAELRRAATIYDDRTIQLSRAASGAFVADLPDLETGQWTVRFSVRSHETGDLVFVAQKELTVQSWRQ